MWRFILFFWLIAVNAESNLFPAAQAFEIPNWFKSSFLNISDDIKEANTQNKRLILFVHQNDCPYCAKFIHELNIPDIKKYAQAHFDMIEINLYGDREVSGIASLGVDNNLPEKEFSSQLEIFATPTLLFLNEAGEIILRMSGYYNSDRFKFAMQYAAEQQEKQFKNFHDYLQSRN